MVEGSDHRLTRVVPRDTVIWSRIIDKYYTIAHIGTNEKNTSKRDLG